MALGKGIVHRANSLYKRGMQFASDLDRAVHIGKQGLGIIAPKLNNFMGDYLAQGALSGVMHGIGAYDELGFSPNWRRRATPVKVAMTARAKLSAPHARQRRTRRSGSGTWLLSQSQQHRLC